jgi:hypothetical protein
VSKDYNHEIGYESLLKDFERYRKQSPRGVSLAKKDKTIVLQFKIGNKSRSQYGCNCSFTLDGMVDALSKARKVAEALKTFTSEVEFWQWYDKEIKGIGQIKNDVLTFGEAIAKVEQDFWNRLSRTRRKRDKNNPSDQSSWNDTYGSFYKLLPVEKKINFKDMLAVVMSKREGTRVKRYAVSAMKVLARKSKREDILSELKEIDVTQTEFLELQTVELGDFLEWRKKVLGITSSLHHRVDIETRQRWIWVFSMQIVYGLRLSEVFAICNLDSDYKVSEREVLSCYNHPDNPHHLIYIGDMTIFGTTVKTGKRLARPLVPPKYPNIIDELGILVPKVPLNRPTSNNAGTIKRFAVKTASQFLKDWNAPFTQTHADRHLANINGMQAGIPLEVRAQSLGHTPAMNDATYKKRQRLQTTIDLLTNSNTQAIDFVSGLNEAKRLVADYPDSKQVIAKLIAKIYGKNSDEIINLL